MHVTVDTSRTITIPGSPWKMWSLFLLGIVMTALSLAVALSAFPGKPVSLIGRAAGVVGTLFFGFCTVMILWRAITETGPVVTLGPTGIRDVRLAAQEVPWQAIQGLSTWSYQGQQIMVLAVDPAIEAGLQLSTIARMTRGANRALGADGLCITSQGLSVSYDELLALTTAYATAHGGSA